MREHAGWVFCGYVWKEEVVVVRSDGYDDGEYEHFHERILLRVVGSALFRELDLQCIRLERR